MSLWYYFSMICLVCLKQMAEQFFENGFPLASTLNVSKKLYEYAGRLMAMSLLQVGQNLTILNPRRLWSGTQILYRVNSKRGLYQQNKFFFHILQKRSDEQNSIGSFVKVLLILWFPICCIDFGDLLWERGPLVVYSQIVTIVTILLQTLYKMSSFFD